MSSLQIIWFFLIGFILTVYAILDGFDLGVGFWHLFTKKDEERRLLLTSIGPVWDGNEVWLITGGAVIFSAFPQVYAAVFSGLYIPFMLLLFALIFRAVSVEFRGRVPSPRWRNFWDTAFAAGSIISAFLFSIAFGNILRGLPLDESKNFTGTLPGLLNPYAVLIGLLGFSMFITHGALYLVLKTEGHISKLSRNWVQKGWYTYIGIFIITDAVTIITRPQLLNNYRVLPILWILPIFTLVLISMIGFFNWKGKPIKAFLSSVLSIAGLMAMSGAALFPNIVPALNNPRLSLTIMNSSSTELTLKTILIITILGIPLVIGYTIWLYRTFGGKVKIIKDVY